MPKLQNNDQKKEESDYSKCENVKSSDSKKTVSSVQDVSNLWKPHSWCRAIRTTDGIEYEAAIIDHTENQRANVHFVGMEFKHNEIKPFSELKTSFGKKEREAQWRFLKLKDIPDVELNNQNSNKGFQQLLEEAMIKLEKKKAFLEKEIQSMKESRICKICMDKKINTVLLPCGHLLSCDECAASFNICPWCRKLIDSKVRMYFC